MTIATDVIQSTRIDRLMGGFGGFMLILQDCFKMGVALKRWGVLPRS